MAYDRDEAELSWLGRQLTSGRLSRRDFMGRAVALGVTTALASTLSAQALRAATPKKGGRFRLGIGHGSTTDTLDPATWTNLYVQMIGGATQNKLTLVSSNGDLVPELAESWEPSSDAVQWRFNLRKGVEYHNGKTLEAADVIASFNHHRGEDSKSAAKPIVSPIQDIKADGKNTVVFTMKSGNADFPFIASDYHLAILPSKDGKVDASSGIGTGSYTLDSFDPGVRTALKRFPNI